MSISSGPWATQIASDVVRDGLGVELIDGQQQVVAEIFRCDADHTVFLSLFVRQVPLHTIEMLVSRARESLEPFEDGTPLASGNQDVRIHT